MGFVEVAVGVRVGGTFHYEVPPHLHVKRGARVLVPFGRQGVSGVVLREVDRPPPEAGTIRAITEVLDAEALDPALVELCVWMAEYYDAPAGEVLRAALPPGTSSRSRDRVVLTPAGRAALAGDGPGALPPRVLELLGQVARKKKLPGRVIAELGDLVATVTERDGARVKARSVTTVSLARPPTDDERVKIARAPRRAAVLGVLEAEGTIDATELAARVPGAAAAVTALVLRGHAVRGSREVLRDPWKHAVQVAQAGAPEPNAEQAAALVEITAAVDGGRFAPFLLFGVTGSGKTEVYLRAIGRALELGKGAIVLVPEIALTPQLATRFRARFGDRVAVLHSGLSEGERFDEWRRLRSGDARIALGARSAIFAPVENLGIVVVDEEHDSSFKQEEGVRYHARDVALVRAQRSSAVCVLGSATPSLETYALAQEGKHRLLVLAKRATRRPLPEVSVVDLRTFRPDKETLLTAPLAEALQTTLAAGEQAILFLNRRGFATFVVCVGCGHSFRCPQCSVSLTYHRFEDHLTCHYCGHQERIPATCPGCQADGTIRRFGLGTERIEAALKERFPGARVGRLDRDTAAGRGLGDVLGQVTRREIDILVGTQMVTKGHDFPDVTLVGVLMADTGLSLPDFRASERTFQLLMQVAGRAGRGDRPGRVIVQSYAPTHVATEHARTHDYVGFFAAESEARKELGYPPHGRLVALRIEGADAKAVEATVATLAARARSAPAGVTVLGPAEAPLKQLKGKLRYQLWLKGADRRVLRSFARWLTDGLDSRNARVVVDVDPISSL